MAPKSKQPDDGTYVSSSTIDNPPRPEPDEKEGEPKQASMFPEVPNEENAKKELDGDSCSRQFGVELTLKLKRGRTYTIPLLSGEYNSLDVLGLLDLALKGRRNRIVIESILDNPVKEEQPAAEATAEASNEGEKTEVEKKTSKKSKKAGDKTASARNAVHGGDFDHNVGNGAEAF